MRYLFLVIISIGFLACNKNTSAPQVSNQTIGTGTYGYYFFYDSLTWNGHSTSFFSSVDSGIAYPNFDSCIVWASGKKDTINYYIKTTYITNPADSIACEMNLNNRKYKFNKALAYSMGGAMHGDTIKAVYVSGISPDSSLCPIVLGPYTIYQAFNIPVRFVH